MAPAVPLRGNPHARSSDPRTIARPRPSRHGQRVQGTRT
jgi:hypothetical protein